MARELVSINAGELTRKLREKYGISQPQVYKRLTHLGIKSHKENGEVWLTSDELQMMDNLNIHLQSGQTMNTYRPQPLDTQEVEANPAPTGSTSVLVHDSEPKTLDTPVETLQVEQVTQNAPALETIRQSAQSKAAGQLIFQNLLTGQYLNNPNLLDEQYRQAIAASEVHATPKPFNPTLYAQTALEQLLPSMAASS